jgi:hypothetical protein
MLWTPSRYLTLLLWFNHAMLRGAPVQFDRTGLQSGYDPPGIARRAHSDGAGECFSEAGRAVPGWTACSAATLPGHYAEPCGLMSGYRTNASNITAPPPVALDCSAHARNESRRSDGCDNDAGQHASGRTALEDTAGRHDPSGQGLRGRRRMSSGLTTDAGRRFRKRAQRRRREGPSRPLQLNQTWVRQRKQFRESAAAGCRGGTTAAGRHLTLQLTTALRKWSAKVVSGEISLVEESLVRLADRHGGANGVRVAAFAFLKPRLGMLSSTVWECSSIFDSRLMHSSARFRYSAASLIERIKAENTPVVCPVADTRCSNMRRPQFQQKRSSRRGGTSEPAATSHRALGDLGEGEGRR